MSYTFTDALNKQLSLPLCQGHYDIDNNLICRLRRIQSRLKHLDVDFTSRKVSNGGHCLVQIAPESVEMRHDNGVTRSHVRQSFLRPERYHFEPDTVSKKMRWASRWVSSDSPCLAVDTRA
nr:hypothetical protein [Rothia mucilaginosa]